MKKLLLMLTVLFSVGFLYSCQDTSDEGLKVSVSIVPQAAFVEEVGGDLVDVTTVIPVGFSPANYEPSARQIVEINNSQVYFALGVPAESANIIPELEGLNIVRLQDYVAEAYDDRYFGDEHEEEDHDEEEDHEDDGHSHFGRDPHIWLSIKRVKVMVQVIADELSRLDPDNENTYQTNASNYISDLDNLNTEIEAMFEDKTMKSFIVYHPSFGYFADDYGLEMLALEEDGKEATITHLQEIIDFARDNNINRIYHQAEIDNEQVQTFKNDIDGISVELYPLSYDYIESMRDMAQKISEGLS
jgi:zinc transport system substrate-binding protein